MQQHEPASCDATSTNSSTSCNTSTSAACAPSRPAAATAKLKGEEARDRLLQEYLTLMKSCLADEPAARPSAAEVATKVHGWRAGQRFAKLMRNARSIPAAINGGCSTLGLGERAAELPALRAEPPEAVRALQEHLSGVWEPQVEAGRGGSGGLGQQEPLQLQQSGQQGQGQGQDMAAASAPPSA